MTKFLGCIVCGKDLQGKRKDSKVCSPECRLIRWALKKNNKKGEK